MNEYAPPPPQPHPEAAPAPAALPAPEKGGPDVMTYVLPILRSWPMIGALAVVGCIGGVLFSLTKPNEYQSVGKLQIRGRLPGEIEGVVDIDNTGWNPENWKQMFADPVVAERVAELVGPAEVLMPYDPAANDAPNKSELMRKIHEFQSWYFGGGRKASAEPSGTKEGLVKAAGQKIRGTIVVDNIRYSQVFSVSYESHNKKLAQRIVRTFMEVCKRKELENNQADAETMRIMSEERDEKNQAAQAAEQALIAFLGENDIHDFEHELSRVLEEEQKLRNEIDEYQSQLSLTKEQLAEIEKELSDPKMTENVEQPFPDQPSPNFEYAETRAAIKAYERRLEEFEDRGLGAEHEDVQRVAKRKAAMEEKLRTLDEVVMIPVPPQQVLNDRYSNLKNRQEIKGDRIKELEAHLRLKEPRLPAVSARVAQLRGCEGKLRVLRAESTNKRADANTITTELEKFRISDKMDKAGISRLLVLHDADAGEEARSA